MIPPLPGRFRSGTRPFYAELTAGLWRALVAPWLASGGGPARTGAPPGLAAGAGGSAAGPPDSVAGREVGCLAGPRCQAEPDAGGRVIRVPRARWLVGRE